MNAFRQIVNMTDPNLPLLAYIDDSNNNPMSSPTHIHEEMELFFVISGKMTFNVQATKYLVNEGESLLINALVPHSSADHSPEYTKIGLLQFLPQTFWPEAGSKHLAQFISRQPYDARLINADTCPEYGEIMKLFITLVDEFNTKDVAYDMFIRSHLCMIYAIMFRSGLLEYKEHDMLKRNNAIYGRIKNVIEYVDENYASGISVESVRSIFSYDYHYFCRMFKRLSGKTFLEYVDFLRINAAVWLLLTTNDPVMDICNRVGYSSHKSFMRAFKNKNGVTPVEYRQRMSASR